MKKTDLRDKTFEELIEKLQEKCEYITSYENLKDFAIEEIKNENLYLALHVLEAITDDSADWYYYDYSMGTLETPSSRKNKEDILTLDSFIDVFDD